MGCLLHAFELLRAAERSADQVKELCDVCEPALELVPDCVSVFSV